MNTSMLMSFAHLYYFVLSTLNEKAFKLFKKVS